MGPNNIYPTIQQYGQPSQYQPPTLNWSVTTANSERDANAFMIAPGNGVVIVQSDGKAVYVRSVDMFGNQSSNTYVTPEQNNATPTSYVGREEFQELQASVGEILTLVRKANTSNHRKGSQRKDSESNAKSSV